MLTICEVCAAFRFLVEFSLAVVFLLDVLAIDFVVKFNADVVGPVGFTRESLDRDLTLAKLVLREVSALVLKEVREYAPSDSTYSLCSTSRRSVSILSSTRRPLGSIRDLRIASLRSQDVLVRGSETNVPCSCAGLPAAGLSVATVRTFVH